jgi:uncharacterized protein YlaI
MTDRSAGLLCYDVRVRTEIRGVVVLQRVHLRDERLLSKHYANNPIGVYLATSCRSRLATNGLQVGACYYNIYIEVVCNQYTHLLEKCIQYSYIYWSNTSNLCS